MYQSLYYNHSTNTPPLYNILVFIPPYTFFCWTAFGGTIQCNCFNVTMLVVLQLVMLELLNHSM